MWVLFLTVTLKNLNFAVKYEELKPNSEISKVFSYPGDSKKPKHPTPQPLAADLTVTCRTLLISQSISFRGCGQERAFDYTSCKRN